ncbi:MAG: universal stress protein [Thermodesulfovibrionales bacterium]|nr:universal stress protein [Thermodesulfovibrionales bacterium]
MRSRFFWYYMSIIPVESHRAYQQGNQGGAMFSKILVPTDGSKPARKSIEHAIALAQATGGQLILLSVIDKSAFVRQSVPAMPGAMGIVEPLENLLQRAAESYVDEAEKLCVKKGVPAKKTIRSGHPVEEIIREAKKSKADLIVIGSQGRSALKAAVIGSVTFGIISKESKIPVLVVRN